MTQLVSDIPAAHHGGGGSPRASAPRTQERRNNNNNHRNNRKSSQQHDGTVSDGAIMNTASPRPKRNQRQRQSVGTGAAAGLPPPGHMGNGSGAPRARPISCAGAHMPATPAKEQAYAGPTFQASPAASALPIPKFSKSVPHVGGKGSLTQRMAGEKQTSGSEQSSPESDIIAPASIPHGGHDSPLDLLFKADKAEREKARNSSLTLSPAAVARPPHLTGESRSSLQASYAGSIFLHEMDGDSELLSPRSKGRPNMGERATSSPGGPVRHTESDDERMASTQDLKNILFQTAGMAPSQQTPQSHHARGPPSPEAYFGSPSPFNRSHPSPITPQNQHHHNNNNYSLHYGNRNLSPLFKAARNETPPRPSSLRQEIPSSHPEPPHANLARNYLHHTARTAGPVEMPPLPFPAPHSASFGAFASTRPPHHPPTPHAAAATATADASSFTHPPTGSSPRTGAASDIRSMEDDLRRMLRI